ncbi:MAG TPA: hypothetical protein VLE19_12990 [Pyrinomonadaceae bacterium]|nr:hypothetical protein [Pyrinomonadaceae bacterium]
MKILLFVPLLFLALNIPQLSSADTAPVTISDFKWSKARRPVETSQNVEGLTPPASAMIAQNKNFARNVRVNEPMGVRDPNADTLDGRSAQLEKNVQEARSPQTKQVDGFAYRVKVKNAGDKVVEVLFWEYQFLDPTNAENVTRHQFLCGLTLAQGKEKELEGFSVSNPSSVVNVEALGMRASRDRERVVINRVEFADGSMWQRRDWTLKEVKGSYERALREPWLPGMCKSL